MTAPPHVDFDFLRYVTLRKGQAAKQAREGAAYAYSGDRKAMNTLLAARPITLAIEATVRLWQNIARADLLGSCIKVSDQQFPRIYEAARNAATSLGIPTPTVYVQPSIGELNAHTLGTTDEAYIVVSGALVDHLDDQELAFVLGHECGHLHNNHVVFTTCMHFLTTATAFYMQWIVQPALLALKAWSRRAEITCDRAGLIAVRDLEVASSSMVKLALGSKKLYDEINMQQYLKQLEEGRSSVGRFTEFFRSHPYLPKRVMAMRSFADSLYYKRLIHDPNDPNPPEGLDSTECDLEVSKLVSVL